MKIAALLSLTFLTVVHSAFASPCSSNPIGQLEGRVESLASCVSETTSKFLPMDQKTCLGPEARQLNFGVLVYNNDFKIYRSTGLGKEGLVVYKTLLDQNQLEAPKKIIYMNKYGYRSGFPKSVSELKSSLTDLGKGIWYKGKALIDPKSKVYHSGPFAKQQQEISEMFKEDSGSDSESDNDLKSSLFGFDFVHPQKQNVYLDGKLPLKGGLKVQKIKGQEDSVARKGGRDAIYDVLRELLTTDGPVSFHCKGGIHRTGMAALMIRYLQGGDWTHSYPEPLHMDEVKRDKKKIEGGVDLANAAEYEYYLFNHHNFRKENLESIRALASDHRFECLKEKFGPLLNQTSTLPKSSALNSCFSSVKEGIVKETRLKAVQKNELWDSCNSFVSETQIANQIDELEGYIGKGKKRTEEESQLMGDSFERISNQIREWRNTSRSAESGKVNPSVNESIAEMGKRMCDLLQKAWYQRGSQPNPRLSNQLIACREQYLQN